jgi:hypothetical protein
MGGFNFFGRIKMLPPDIMLRDVGRKNRPKRELFDFFEISHFFNVIVLKLF